MNMQSFINALESRSLSSVAKIPKSDIHSHAGRGGRQEYLSKKLSVDILPQQNPFKGLSDMQEWYDANIKLHMQGLTGQIIRYEAAFAQAQADNITVLAMSFGLGEIELLGGVNNFISCIDSLCTTFAPDTQFYPELALDRESNTEKLYSGLDAVFSKKWFYSIDICNNEWAQPITAFKKIYRKARSYGLTLKAHVGEFGCSDDVWEAIEELELDEVHHGIASAKSHQLLKWLEAHKIQLNICPASNIKLGIVNSYENHPIKIIYDSGVLVTINTDDLLVFDVSVSEEYLNLFDKGVFTAEELNKIRKTGVNAYQRQK